MGKENLYCYLRVSTQRQVEEGNSIENQRYHGKNVSKKLGYNYVELNEGGESSTNESRKVFNQLKDDIKSGKIRKLWYFSRSRWSRTLIEDLIIKRDYFQKYNVEVFEGESGSKRNFKSSSEQLLDTLLTSVQEYDRLQRREVSISGKKHLSISHGDKGVFLGGTINFGYKNVDKKWVINRVESKWVKKMFQLYSEGKSLVEIKSVLDTNGVKPRRSKLWNTVTIHTILRNRTYVGEISWVDKDSGEKFYGIVPQIISHSLFDKVQKKLEKNRRFLGNNSRIHETLLGGLLVCECRENITGVVKEKQGKSWYWCSSIDKLYKSKKELESYKKQNSEIDIIETEKKIKNYSQCKNRRTLNMKKTDELIVKSVKKIVSNSHILKERFKTDILSKKDTSEKELSELKNVYEKDIKKLNRNIDLITKNISINEVNKMMNRSNEKVHHEIKNKLNEELEKVQKDKDLIINKIVEIDNQKNWIDWISKYKDKVEGEIENIDTKFLEEIISDIVVSGTYLKNRDGEIKQTGHLLKVKFKLPLFNDKLEWIDEKNKKKGYKIINGKKSLNLNQEISLGGRGVR